MGLVAYIGQIDSHATIAIYAATSIILFFVSIILWKFPTLIARNLTNFSEVNESEIKSEDADKILQIALITLGVYFLYYVVSDFMSWGYYWFSIIRNPDYQLGFNIEQKADIFATFAELGMAAFLIIGSIKLVQIIKKLRHG